LPAVFAVSNFQSLILLSYSGSSFIAEIKNDLEMPNPKCEILATGVLTLLLLLV
jgi:hypothetical protein